MQKYVQNANSAANALSRQAAQLLRSATFTERKTSQCDPRRKPRARLFHDRLICRLTCALPARSITEVARNTSPYARSARALSGQGRGTVPAFGRRIAAGALPAQSRRFVLPRRRLPQRPHARAPSPPPRCKWAVYQHFRQLPSASPQKHTLRPSARGPQSGRLAQARMSNPICANSAIARACSRYSLGSQALDPSGNSAPLL